MISTFYVLAFITFGFVVFWEREYLDKIRISEGFMFTVDNVPLNNKTPDRFPFLLSESLKCVHRTPFLVLLIPSVPEDAATRDAIRMTWGNESLVPGVHIVRIFLLGVPLFYSVSVRTTILWESATFRDIVQQDFSDTYNNLTIKTVMGMEWISRFCPNVSYVMKIDTDMFLNPEFLIRHLLQPNLEVRRNFFTGIIVHRGWPERHNSSKYYAPKEVYWGEVYPPYCSGTGYLFSGDVATKVFHISQIVRPLFVEDVYVGLCLAKLRIRLTNPPKDVFIGERIEYDRCRFAKLITVHHYTKEELVRLWPDFLEAKKTC